MKHVILLAYILIFSTGFASLAGLVVLSLRLSHSFFKRMILVQSLFIINLALVAIYYYVVQILNLIGTNTRLAYMFSVGSLLLNIILYIGLLLLINSIKLSRQSKRIYTLTRLGFRLCIAILVAQLGVLLFGWRQPAALQMLFYLLVAITMGLLGYLLLIAPKEYEHRSYRTVVKGFGICCLGFVPLGILEYLLAVVLDFSYQPLSLEYLLYLGINSTIIIAFIQVLAKEPKSGSAFTAISQQSLSRFSLTAREQEMALLIARSLTNKEIAAKLGISEATVRTHIYNLFQKVGASNRIELLNLINQ